jgi:hypothetical protein
VPELDEVVHGLLEPGRVVRAHDVHRPVPHRAGDDHHREPGRECRQVDRRRLRAEQHQRLAAVLQQAPHRALLVAPRCHRAQRQLVAHPVRRRVQPAHQVAVERVLHAEHHAEQPAAAAAQQPGADVGAVAQLVRDGQHSLPSRRARAGHLPHDDRHQRRRDVGTRRDVRESGAPIHAGHTTRTFY